MVRVEGTNGTPVFINESAVAAIVSLIGPDGVQIIGESGIKLITGEAVRVRGGAEEVAALFSSKKSIVI